MTPIELALAKVVGTVMSEAGDMAIDKTKDGLVGMISSGKSTRQQQKENLYKGFLADSNKKEEIKSNTLKAKKESDYHRKKMSDIDNYIGLTNISERFSEMVNSMNKGLAPTKMRMVANRIKKKSKKKRGKKK